MSENEGLDVQVWKLKNKMMVSTTLYAAITKPVHKIITSMVYQHLHK